MCWTLPREFSFSALLLVACVGLLSPQPASARPLYVLRTLQSLDAQIQIIDPSTGVAESVIVSNVNDSFQCQVPNWISIDAQNDEIYLSCSYPSVFVLLSARTGRLVKNFNYPLPTFYERIGPYQHVYDNYTGSVAVQISGNGGDLVGILYPKNPNSAGALPSAWGVVNSIYYDGLDGVVLAAAIYWGPPSAFRGRTRVPVDGDGYQNPCKNVSLQFSESVYRWQNNKPASCSTKVDNTGRYAFITTGTYCPHDGYFYVVGMPYDTDFDKYPMGLLRLNRWTGEVVSSFSLPFSLNELQSPEFADLTYGTLDLDTMIFTFTLYFQNQTLTRQYLANVDTIHETLINYVNLAPKHGYQYIHSLSYG